MQCLVALVFKPSSDPISLIDMPSTCRSVNAARSLAAGRIIPQDDPRTIADGLRTSLGERTFAVISRAVDGIATATEEGIVGAMRLTWEKMRIVVEASSAVPLACLMERTLDLAGQRVGVIVSGGNVDLDRLPWQR